MLNVNTDRETEALTRASSKAEASQLCETPSTGVVECFNICSVAVAARPDTKQALVPSSKVEEEQQIPEAIVVREIKGLSEKSCHRILNPYHYLPILDTHTFSLLNAPSSWWCTPWALSWAPGCFFACSPLPHPSGCRCEGPA